MEYNLDVTAKLIRNHPHLDNFLGLRLYEDKRGPRSADGTGRIAMRLFKPVGPRRD